jgi:hypothetical protein
MTPHKNRTFATGGVKLSVGIDAKQKQQFGIPKSP